MLFKSMRIMTPILHLESLVLIQPFADSIICSITITSYKATLVYCPKNRHFLNCGKKPGAAEKQTGTHLSEVKVQSVLEITWQLS